jgi:hypothetical protein
MTFNKAAWAVDGALLNSALARSSTYATSSGAQGVTQGADLKVTQLGTPGPGLQIAAGTALVLNRYQTTPSQTYVVSNAAAHTVTSGEMPASNPSARSYVLAVVVGDPEFSQSGHPFMLASDPPSGQAAGFTYVRPVMISVSSGATTVPGNFPALPLARIDIPANTTTVTQAMITDLRQLVGRRTYTDMGSVVGPANDPVNSTGATWERMPAATIVDVVVPTWATEMRVIGYLEGVKISKAVQARIQPYIEGTSIVGYITNVDEGAPGSGNPTVTRNYNVGGKLNVSSLRGQAIKVSIRAQVNNDPSAGGIATDPNSTALLQVFFEEQTF